MIDSTGVASTFSTLVEYNDQQNTGIRYQVMPGARRRWMVTMKLRPVRIDEKPATKPANVVPKTCVFEYCVENGV